MHLLSAQCICNHICFARVIQQLEVIMFYVFHPPALPHVQFFLIEQVPQALVVAEHLKLGAIQIMSPSF